MTKVPTSQKVPPSNASGKAPSLQAWGLAKTFGGQRALRDVDLSLAPQEVVALLGENGSGKSTLVKILAGYHEPDSGARIDVGGKPLTLPVSPGDHRSIGLAFVFQDLGLAPQLSVVENLFAGRRIPRASSRTSAIINWASERREAQEIFDRYDVDLNPAAKVAELRPTAQALLAIVRSAEELRAFRADSGDGFGGVLVLDEPTVFLPEHEKIFLYDLVRRVAADGTATLFVSHDMTAVREIADRAIVLCDGEKVGDVAMASTTNAQLVGLVSGHRLSEDAIERAAAAATSAPTSANDQRGATALEVRDASGGRLTKVTFTVHAGEIVGVAGLLGSGSEDLPYVLFGAESDAGGEMRCGQWSGPIASLSPAQARRLGLALVPGDRKQQAIAADLSVEKNLFSLVLERFRRHGALNPPVIRKLAAARVDAYDVRPRNPALNIGALSGGNQQKVVLARWLETSPTVLLLHEPTQGVDVATRQEIYALLRARARSGTAILWVSTDFDELATISDRILLCANGTIAEQLSPPFSRDLITRRVYGSSAEQPHKQETNQ